jgi:hypothetical protein
LFNWIFAVAAVSHQRKRRSSRRRQPASRLPLDHALVRDLLRVGQVRGEEVMANSPAGKPPESPPPFDPDETSPRELRDQPLSVIKTELPALANALGVTPAELFRSLSGETVQPETARAVRGARERMMAQAIEAMETSEPTCCYSDSW